MGSPAKCQTCGWHGQQEQLYTVPFHHTLAGREGIGDELFNDLRKMMQGPEFMTSFVRFLDRWGFISLTAKNAVTVEKVAKYGSSAARAVINAVIAMRTNEEREKVHGTIPANTQR